MKKVLIAYFSLSGNTQKMAEYMAEGIRIAGQEVKVKKIADLKEPGDLAGYDGYIFGCPTYHRDMTEPMKKFLFTAKKAGLEGKLAGAFGSYTHDGNAPEMVFSTMQYVFKMEPFELGPLNMLDTLLEETGRDVKDQRRYIGGEVHEAGEGMHACQDYGKVFAETLGS
jgi:flavodoxin